MLARPPQKPRPPSRILLAVIGTRYSPETWPNTTAKALTCGRTRYGMEKREIEILLSKYFRTLGRPVR
jgi:hypothetical protein